MKGKVYLVGGGPGDLGLMTRKAFALIQQADCLVYDRLIDNRILLETKVDCECIYVGKAKVLRNRVRQYFQSSRNQTVKTQSMVPNIKEFEYIVTDSELEALVLENNYIKEYNPKYNTLLKDGKTYPYIKVTRPITTEPDSYQTVMGYPSYINTTLGQCDDLCVCAEIDLKTITGATPSELERIRQYCLNGVHV